MAIHVSCPACRSEAAVDDSLAGKDVLCPHCQARVTVPSLAAGAPDEHRIASTRDEPRFGEARSYGDDEVAPLPRYRVADDEDFRTARDSSAWGTTATGLALIFWSGAVLTVVNSISNLLTMLLGHNPQALAMGPGAAPRPELLAFSLFLMVAGCFTIVLVVIYFVGMCMCCTAPAESGAKGKAIAAVVCTVALLVGGIGVMIAAAAAAFNQVQMGVAPAPGQLPFSPAVFILVSVAGGLMGLLLLTLWMLFHKAVADYFGNRSLARASLWFIAAFIGFGLIAQMLNWIANPQMFEGNLLAPPPDRTLALLSQGWALAGLIALSIWFLVIVRETRRTILEGGPQRDSYSEG